MSEATTNPEASREERPGLSPERRALVADGDLSIRSLVTKVLRREGFMVDAAESGPAALTLLAERAYAVIVLDLAMPQVTGVELLEYLRHRDARALRRVVVITTSVPRVRPALPPDICHILTKPFDLVDFQAAVARCTNESDA
jgi:CheY-like chemotaxis protein